MKVYKIILGIILFVFSIVLFYELFFKLTPYIVSTLPANEWHNFLGIVIYGIVGYFGGIIIPLLGIIWGVVLILMGVTE